MAELHRFPEQRREFLTDGDRSALRATWHNDSGYVVISLWRGDTCVATSHMTPSKAARLAGFITAGLGELAQESVVSSGSITPISRLSLRDRLENGIGAWRDSVGWLLERIARRIRR